MEVDGRDLMCGRNAHRIGPACGSPSMGFHPCTAGPPLDRRYSNCRVTRLAVFCPNSVLMVRVLQTGLTSSRSVLANVTCSMPPFAFCLYRVLLVYIFIIRCDWLIRLHESLRH